MFLMKNQIITDLLNGKVVTVPTETVEGYAVMLNSKIAVEALMKLKDRDYDSDKIFTLIPESKSAISKYAIIPPKAQIFIDKYVPGEITLILPKNPDFHNFYFDEFARRGRKIGIGIRIPNHPLFPEIAESIGSILLTSANTKGAAPKSLTGHKPSTVVDFTTDTPKILRQGDLELYFSQEM